MKESIALFLLVSTQIIASAKAAEVRIPYKVRSTAFCEAMLRGMEVHGLEKGPDESHESLARNFLGSLKTELGIYQINPDRRLRNLSISSENMTQANRALLASRIDGIFSDDQASHKAYLRLKGRDKIESFFGEVLKREHLLAQHLLLTDSRYLRMSDSIYRLGMVAALLGLLTDFKPAIIKVAVAYAAARFFTEKIESLRLSRRFNEQLMLPLAEFKSGWHYSSTRFSVSMDLRCPTLGDLPPELVANHILNDHRNYFDCVLGAIIYNSPKAWTGYRHHAAIDQFYRWDDLNQEPELVIVFRHYNEKPKNPKTQSQKQSEKGPLWSPLPSPSG